jgi:hypothetical protein
MQLLLFACYVCYRETQQRSWLRHYATSRMVAGSIPNEVSGLSKRPNPASSSLILTIRHQTLSSIARDMLNKILICTYVYILTFFPK